MSTALRQMERVLRVREARERMGEAAFAAEQAKVRRADAVLRRTEEAQQRAIEQAREGLIEGEWNSWWMGESEAAIAERVREKCKEVRRQAVEVAEAARLTMIAARIEAEQSRMLESAMRKTLNDERARREQAVSDDRFAARAHWNEMQVERREVGWE